MKKSERLNKEEKAWREREGEVLGIGAREKEGKINATLRGKEHKCGIRMKGKEGKEEKKGKRRRRTLMER